MTKLQNFFSSTDIAAWKIFILIFFFWLGFLSMTGTLSSGFHFTDDHDILRIEKEVAQSNIGKEIGLFFKEIFSSVQRFRPLHALQRRIGAAVFGTDWIAWSIYFGILAIFTSFFLFLFMRELRFSRTESILFTALTLLGTQAAIWWKLGTNETLGMFFMALSLLLMAKSGNQKEQAKKQRLTSGFIVSAVLMSWCKESFILVLPALALGLIWLGAGGTESREKETKKSWKQALKENAWVAAMLIIVCVAEILHIAIKVGTTSITYAGYDGFSLSVFLRTLFNSLIEVHGWLIPALLAVCGGFWFHCHRGNKPDDTHPGPRGYLAGAFIFAVFIAGPQVILYMKSGIRERYLLPGILGYTFLIIALFKYIRLKWGTRRVVVIGLTVLLIGVSLQQLRISRYTALAFTNDGRTTAGWLESISNNLQPDDDIYVITHPIKHLEPSFALRKYLKFKFNMKKVRFVPPNMNLPLRKIWELLNQFAPPPCNREQITAFLVFPGLEKSFLKYNYDWFLPENFNRYSNDGGYVTYYKLISR